LIIHHEQNSGERAALGMGSISVKNLGKAYRQYPSRWARMAEWLGPGARTRHAKRWVLRGVSFEIGAGEAVGIVGLNGAGKSTLLKMITGTSQPTEGTVSVRGRIAPLLELGMGFHPDFTGRQNALMAGQLLGFTTAQMRNFLPWITEFAEIGDYMDMPVRVYSSGMQMRLAFAVACCERPDVLIVDEALSVGDAYFQHKSLRRIKDFAASGTTLLIVSHDRNAIQAICGRAILLRDGAVALDGAPEAVMDFYNALLSHDGQSHLEQVTGSDGRTQTRSGTLQAVVESIELQDGQGRRAEELKVGDRAVLEVTVRVQQAVASLVLGYGIKDRLGQVMYGTNTWHTGQVVESPAAGARYRYRIDFPVHFGVGTYSVQTALVDRDSHLSANFEWRDLALVFKVVNTDHRVFDGCAWAEPMIEVTTL
jgi:lipopolysaccharide transport system ATP-binding protein